MCHGLSHSTSAPRSGPKMSETEEAAKVATNITAAHRESEASGSSSERAGEDQPTPAKKKRNRRGKHRRRWKPYSKMTPEERQQAESREAARAARRERGLVGKPAAPWNTTQFIMDNHDCGEVNLTNASISRTISLGSYSASDEGPYESPEESGVESEVFWNRDYEMVVAELEEEELRDLSHSELVKQCLQLKEEVRRLREEKTATLVQPSSLPPPPGPLRE